MSKKTLNHANLTTLGADRLAALLLEVSTGSAEIKRRLRLELSHNLGPQELGRDVRKRLVSLRRSSSFVGWRKRKALIKDLTTQAEMITDKIAPDDPSLAFDLLWQFLDLAASVYERTDDSRGDVGDVFRGAIQAFDEISTRAVIDPMVLANRVWEAVCDNGYGEFDGIIGHVAPALGAEGFAQLKSLVASYAETPLDLAEDDHEALQFLRALRGTTNDYRADQKAARIKAVLQDIAEAEGDTGAYIAQYSDQDLTRPAIAAEVAQLMRGNGDPQGALEVLEAADVQGRGGGQEAWDAAFTDCLIALDRMEDAQAHRWTRFTQTLKSDFLRPYLKALPDFADIDAEDRARAYALEFPDAMRSLRFFLEWPDHASAAALILKRGHALNGDRYDILTPAAEALRDRYPLAAVVLWRTLIDFALEQGRASRYIHAADHLADCGLADAHIEDYGQIPPHHQYLEALQIRHERKTSFWAKLASDR